MKNELENKKTKTLERTLLSDNATLDLCRKKERAKSYRGAHKVATSKNEVIAKKEGCSQHFH